MAKHKLTSEYVKKAIQLKKGGANHKDIAAAIGVTVDLDPHYADVIIQRWEDVTGRKAVKV